MSGSTASRRKFLSIVAGGIGAFWTTAVAAMSATVIFAPLIKKRRDDAILLGDLSIYEGRQYRAIRMRIPVQDGWYERTRERIVYVRGDEKGLPEVISGTCTHLGCTVSWNSEENEFQCPCHGGRFSPEGEVLSGPPPKALPKIPAEIRGGDIYVRLDA